MPRICAALSAFLLLSLSVVTSTAQPAPVQVIQGSDGTLYLAQGTNAWTMAPNSISDAELASLTPSGELDGAIPATFLSASDVLAPLQAVQDGSGTLYLAQGGNVWILVPTPVGDAELAALNIVGQIGGEISAPALTLPGPGDAVPGPPVEAAQPPAAPPPPSVPPPSGSNGTIAIVSSMPRQGPGKVATDSIVNAFRMALDEAQNTAGGYSIVYRDFDNATAAKGGADPAQEAYNANRARNDADVMVYLGSIGGTDIDAPVQSELSRGNAAMVSIPILCAANLGMISPANAYPGFTKSFAGVLMANEPDVYYPHCKRNFARVIPTGDVQAAAAARWSKDLGANSAYVLYDARADAGFDVGPAQAYILAAAKVGLRVVGDPQGVDPQGSDLLGRDYPALAQKIRLSGADVVFFGIDNVSFGSQEQIVGPLWQQLRATLGGNFKLIGTNGMFTQAFVDAAGAAGEGTYSVSSSVPSSKLSGAGAQWYANYKAAFNAEPDGYAIYGYEAMKVALDAIQRAGKKDHAAIRDAIFGTRNYAGVLGTWSFGDSGDTTLTTVYGRQVKNGRFDDANAVVLHAP